MIKIKPVVCNLQLVAVTAFLSLPGCHWQRQPEITRQPEISNPYLWDFGRVKEGEILKHNFILKNESQDVLNIKDVNTSCGCTVSKVEKKALLPDETALMEVEFDTKGYSGLTQQYIYVYTDNLDTSTPLSINGERPSTTLGTSPEFIEGRSRTIDTSTSLSINGERPSTTLGTSPEFIEGRSRTIDNPILRFIIKADIIRRKDAVNLK